MSKKNKTALCREIKKHKKFLREHRKILSDIRDEIKNLWEGLHTQTKRVKAMESTLEQVFDVFSYSYLHSSNFNS